MVNKQLFLSIMRAALHGNVLDWNMDVDEETWVEVFNTAQQQSVLPMVYEAIHNSTAFKPYVNTYGIELKRMTMSSIIQQIQQTDTFLSMYKEIQSKGYEPIVVKGILLRSIYPQPDERSSGDEDIYIPSNTYNEYKKILNEANMYIASWDQETEDTNHELSYVHANRKLRIEVHKDLFDNELTAFKGMNELFKNAFDTSILININGVDIRTMNHSDHLFFLIVHAFKHFINSGIGLRQICDINMFANHYGNEIDWKYIYDRCVKSNIEVFAATLFRIGENHLGFDFNDIHYPDYFRNKSEDEENLLNDLFDAGIFGSSDMTRKHSGTITLNAVNAQSEGKDSKPSLLRSLFPNRKSLENRFTYLQKYPFLLPIAWITRIIQYSKETKNSSNNDAIESLNIGMQRVELLKQYGILK